MSDPEPEWGILPSFINPGSVDLCALWNDKIYVCMPIRLEAMSDIEPEMFYELMQDIVREMEAHHQDERIRQGLK